MLNSTFDSINNTISTGEVSPGYLFATLTAANASIPESGGDANTDPSSSSNSGGGGTDLAMWVLHVRYDKFDLTEICRQDCAVCDYWCGLGLILFRDSIRG